MTLTGLLTTQLPLGKTIFLAWIIATYLYFQHQVDITIPNFSPIEFALFAGLVFGYYMFIHTTVILIILFSFYIYMFYSVITEHKLSFRKYGLVFIEGAKAMVRGIEEAKERNDTPSKIGRILARALDIAAMAVTFLFASNQELLLRYAPFGLFFTLVLFALGAYDSNGK